MIKQLLTLTVIGFILCSGCTKRKDHETGNADTPPAIPLQPGQLQMPSFPTDPKAILVEVNGEKLTIGEADEQIRIRMAARGMRIPPDQVQQARPMLMLQVVDQYLAKTLLTQEAEKQKIAVTEEDEKDALDKIRESLPEGVKLEDAMAESKMGKEQMMEELRTSIRITKLLEPITKLETEVTPEEVSDFREKNKEKLTVPESVQARHILLKVDEGADEKTRQEKKKAIDDIKKQLTEGADFGELASKHSDCGSAARGGDLGSFGRGDMVPPFEQAAFSQEIGVIGPVIETKFGYHIIKVEKHDKSGEFPTERIIEIIKNGKRQTGLTKYLDSLKMKAKISTHPALDTVTPPRMMMPPPRGAANAAPPRPPMPTPPPAVAVPAPTAEK